MAAAGCGRVGFAAPEDAPADAPAPEYVRFAMDSVAAGSVLVAEPAEYSALCGPCPAVVPGHLGGAYHFDSTIALPLGHGELVSVARPFSIAIWLAPAASLPGLTSALAKPHDLTSVLDVVSLTVDINGLVSYESNSGGDVDAISAPGDVRGAWHHIAMTWDLARRRMYLDGVAVVETLGAFDDSALGLYLGSDLDNGAPLLGFVGDLDELRFYPRALDAAEIAALAQQ